MQSNCQSIDEILLEKPHLRLDAYPWEWTAEHLESLGCKFIDGEAAELRLAGVQDRKSLRKETLCEIVTSATSRSNSGVSSEDAVTQIKCELYKQGFHTAP